MVWSSLVLDRTGAEVRTDANLQSLVGGLDIVSDLHGDVRKVLVRRLPERPF